MFCHKCGAELTDEAIFCQRCGEKVLDEDMFQQSENIDKKQRSVETTRLSADQPQNISDNKVKTKKSKKKLSLLGIIFAAIFLVIFIATNWEGKADYIASVKAHTPFAASQNLPYTYEEVLNKFGVSQ